jgi:hypothetical protein
MMGPRVNSQKMPGSFERSGIRMLTTGTPDIEELVLKQVEKVRGQGFEPAYVLMTWAAYEALKRNRDLGIDEDTIDEVHGLSIVLDFERGQGEVSIVVLPKASDCFR